MEDSLLSAGLIAIPEGIIKQPQLILGFQNTPTSAINVRFAHPTLIQRFLQRGEKPLANHIHVDTGLERPCGNLLQIAQTMINQFIDGGVIRYHKTTEAPLVTEYIRHQPLIGGGWHAIDVVERRHYTPRP